SEEEQPGPPCAQRLPGDRAAHDRPRRRRHLLRLRDGSREGRLGSVAQSSLFGLARFLVPYRYRIAAALLALIVAAACVLALGQGLRHVVDNGFGSGDPRLLNRALAAMITLAYSLSIT